MNMENTNIYIYIERKISTGGGRGAKNEREKTGKEYDL